MPKRLVRHGNSLALVIDKPILELLGIDADTPLEIDTSGDQLIIRRSLSPEFVKAARWVFKKYDKTFKDLAEHDRRGGRRRRK